MIFSSSISESPTGNFCKNPCGCLAIISRVFLDCDTAKSKNVMFGSDLVDAAIFLIFGLYFTLALGTSVGPFLV